MFTNKDSGGLKMPPENRECPCKFNTSYTLFNEARRSCYTQVSSIPSNNDWGNK